MSLQRSIGIPLDITPFKLGYIKLIHKVLDANAGSWVVESRSWPCWV